MYFLYLIKSKYKKITEVTKYYYNDNYYESFPIIDGLYLLLDISSTPKGYKIIFEYNYDQYYKTFEADGYIIDNIDIIDSLYEDKNLQNLKYNQVENPNNNNIESFSYNDNTIENDAIIIRKIPLRVTKEYCTERRMCTAECYILFYGDGNKLH